ncbi:Cryptochrome DASH, chloroplastic/mitochondrial [Symbiodinium microadriaticum]|uniref:Cryptochrome DASH, chloroplastic/mitochondrial n=1 Tax=Symbiodinium microadriaticum TaxID=2951 RepID=A0A1Q9E8Q8_SYMMI|nr:Cryptochrome DASH, chloroplastic/mitochondrial [Symbiodinium microadriaticum]
MHSSNKAGTTASCSITNIEIDGDDNDNHKEFQKLEGGLARYRGSITRDAGPKAKVPQALIPVRFLGVPMAFKSSPVLVEELIREGLHQMPDEYWIRCQELVYSDEDTTTDPSKMPQVPIPTSHMWAMLQNYRNHGDRDLLLVCDDFAGASLAIDPQVAKLFDVIGEYFEVVQVQHGQGLESGSSSETLVKSEGPDDEELDDEELAVALGAPKRELASDLGAGSSVESLHTGLTNELHKVSLDESPPPEIIRVSAPKAVSPSVLRDKRNKIEALKREIEIKKRSINCARPWKRAKPDEPEDTQMVDPFPVAKNLKAEFDAVDDKGRVSANEVASASQQPPALEDSAESQGSDDLFHAEPQEFLTRQSQFADRKQAEEPGDDFDLPEPPKAKAKAKAKSKAKAKAKAKGKAKAKAASKSKASPGKPRGRPRKDKAKPAVHADLKSEAADGEADDPEDELKSQADGEAEHPEAKKEEEHPDDNIDEEKDEPMHAEEKAKVRKSAAPNPIFARRYRPGFCVFAGKRWDAIKASFELIIANRVKTPSTVQAGLQKGARPQAKDNTWDVAKLRKVCDNAAHSFLTLESTQSTQLSTMPPKLRPGMLVYAKYGVVTSDRPIAKLPQQHSRGPPPSSLPPLEAGGGQPPVEPELVDPELRDMEAQLKDPEEDEPVQGKKLKTGFPELEKDDPPSALLKDKLSNSLKKLESSAELTHAPPDPDKKQPGTSSPESSKAGTPKAKAKAKGKAKMLKKVPSKRSIPESEQVVWMTMTMKQSFFNAWLKTSEMEFYGAVIAVKGDMEWHKSLFNLQRSYARSGTVYTGPVCHMCLAGGGGPMFEDYSESPQWRLTCFASRPWGDNEPVPPLATIPAYPAPEELLHLDPFHLCKMGIGRNIAGGILVYLARRQFFDFEGCEAQGFSFPARLERAHRSFLLWTKAEGHHPSLRSFNKAFLNMKSLASAPWCNTKGADTTLMMQWLLWYLTLVLRDPPEFADTGMLQKMRKLAQAYLNMFSSIHGHGLWMTRPCARKLYIEMMRVLRGYQLLGSLCLQVWWRVDHSTEQAKKWLRMLRYWPDLPEVSMRLAFRDMTWLRDAADDAVEGMRELRSTGYLQQQPDWNLRHTVGQFLVETLGVDWRMGEEWFHITLVDSDLAINSMMWQHQGLTGVSQWLIGIDCSWACEGSPSSHPKRHAKAADPKGEYVRYWVPELSKLPLQLPLTWSGVEATIIVMCKLDVRVEDLTTNGVLAAPPGCQHEQGLDDQLPLGGAPPRRSAKLLLKVGADSSPAFRSSSLRPGVAICGIVELRLASRGALPARGGTECLLLMGSGFLV